LKKLIAIWIAGLAVYLAIVGRITLYDFVVGSLISLIAGLIFGTKIIENPGKIFSPRRIFYAIAYMVYYLFVVEPICHFKVATMILGIRKYKPGIVVIDYDYKSEYAVAAIANSITNTPGTVVVDIDPAKKKYYVHWLEAYSLDPMKAWHEIVSQFDKWIKQVFEG